MSIITILMSLKKISLFYSIAFQFCVLSAILVVLLLENCGIMTIPQFFYMSDIMYVVLDFLVFIFPVITLFLRLYGSQHLKNLIRCIFIYSNILLLSNMLCFYPLFLIIVIISSGTSLFIIHFMCTIYILMRKALKLDNSLFISIVCLFYLLLFNQFSATIHNL